jgi:hypothetical protein
VASDDSTSAAAADASPARAERLRRSGTGWGRRGAAFEERRWGVTGQP